jgi:glycosyltransferase involved in cell wall biosynthesis
MLPAKVAGADPSWILSPFNVLPLGPTRGRSPRRAVIVSNIGPFAKEILATSSGYQRLRNSLLRRLTIMSIRRADVVFLLSRVAGDLLEPWLSRKSVHFLPMAPPGPSVLGEAASASVPTELAEPPYFLIAGDLLPYKGVEDALFAMRRLSERGRKVRLIVAGNPVDPSYAKKLAGLVANGAGPHSVFAGSIPHSQVLALMEKALATVLCSRVENTSRIPVEAMAVGSPVVIVDRPYARDTCRDAALYYPAGDADALAKHMEALIDEPEARDRLVERGTKRMAEVDWLAATRMILQTLELL